MLSLRIALRFLRRSPAQTILIVMGISVGIAVQIFIGSLIASLQTYLIDTTLGAAPHLTITNSAKEKPLEYSPALRAAIEADKNIKIALPQRSVSALMSGSTGGAPLTIKSGDPKTMDDVYHISPKIIRGVYILNTGEVVVGKGFAETYGLQPGRHISLVLAGQTQVSLRITAIADFGNKQLNDSLAYVNESFGQAALGMNGFEFSSVIIQLNDVFKSTEDAKLLAKAADVNVADWQIEQKDLLSGLQAQSSSTLMIRFFVIVAVALGIASTLSISAIQKTRQIGILKALGFTDSRAGGVFLWQGAILGLLGSLGGLVLGVGLIGLFQLTAGSNPGSFPITPQGSFIVISILIGVTVSMISAILPSRRTARLDPIEVIQSGG